MTCARSLVRRWWQPSLMPRVRLRPIPKTMSSGMLWPLPNHSSIATTTSGNITWRERLRLESVLRPPAGRTRPRATFRQETGTIQVLTSAPLLPCRQLKPEPSSRSMRALDTTRSRFGGTRRSLPPAIPSTRSMFPPSLGNTRWSGPVKREPRMSPRSSSLKTRAPGTSRPLSRGPSFTPRIVPACPDTIRTRNTPSSSQAAFTPFGMISTSPMPMGSSSPQSLTS